MYSLSALFSVSTNSSGHLTPTFTCSPVHIPKSSPPADTPASHYVISPSVCTTSSPTLFPACHVVTIMNVGGQNLQSSFGVKTKSLVEANMGLQKSEINKLSHQLPKTYCPNTTAKETAVQGGTKRGKLNTKISTRKGSRHGQYGQVDFLQQLKKTFNVHMSMWMICLDKLNDNGTSYLVDVCSASWCLYVAKDRLWVKRSNIWAVLY